jgi:DNA-binding NarL/FixJ family response regulator
MRMGFSMVLGAEDDLEVVGEAADGNAAITMAQALAPDVILMDVRMPGMDGIEATRRITELVPDARILVLTTFDLDEYAFAALRAGASGFLLKDVRPADLTAAIRAVAAGDAAISPRVTRRMLELFSPRLPADGVVGAAGSGRGGAGFGGAGGADGAVGGSQDSPEAARIRTALTPRELEVFEAICLGLSNAEIAQRLVLSETTVKTHVGSILAKLGLRDRVQAVVLGYESGLARGEGNDSRAGRL